MSTVAAPAYPSVYYHLENHSEINHVLFDIGSNNNNSPINYFTETKMFIPRILGDLIGGSQGVKDLICARWEELQVETILLQRDSSMVHQQHTPMQTRLMELRLARAKLETQLYSKALDTQRAVNKGPGARVIACNPKTDSVHSDPIGDEDEDEEDEDDEEEEEDDDEEEEEEA